MQLLTESLDDPEAAACGKCSVCLGHVPGELGEAPPADTARAVAGALRSQSQVLDPRKMWPGGAAGRKGRISPDLAAEPGRVIVFADAPEWTGTIGAARSGDEAAIADLADASVATLARWREHWRSRPEVVASLQLTDRPQPVEPVADRIAEVGRLDRVSLPVPRGPAPGRDASGAQEAAHWLDAIEVDGAAAAAVQGRSVLLVVDTTSTGWAVTVAASRLREAGAALVLPLVLHRPA